MKYKDRIVGLIRVRGDRIVPHPDNWRTHPEHQRDAMRGVLADIGIGDGLKAVPLGEDRIREVLALKTAAEREAWLRAFDASGADVMLLDGHLRAEEIRDQPVPVLILDLLPAEQAEFLATFDPIGSLAAKSTEKLDAVLRQFNSTNAAVQQLVAGLAEIKTGGVDPAANKPSLDDLHEQFGDEHDPKLFWPEVKVKVPPPLFEEYETRMSEQEGEPHERFAALIGAQV